MEEYPAREHDEEQVDVRQDVQLFKEPLEEKTLYEDENEEIEPPEYEIPVRPVPETGERPDDEEVEHRARLGALTPAEGDVDIVAEEGAEGDVPAPPELRYGLGEVGVVEVFQVVQSEHPAHAYGHVGVGGEVEVDLHHEGRDAHPGAEGREARERGEVLRKERGVGGRVRRQQQLISQRAAGIGEQGLFRQSDGEAADAGQDVPAVSLDKELVRDGLVAHYRPRHALVEERSVEQDVQTARLRLGIAAVDVHDVGEQLEGVKGDAYGQSYVRDELRHLPEDGADEPRILEKADERDVYGAGDGDPELPAPLRVRLFYPQRAEPGAEGHEHEQQDVFRLAPGIENEGKDQQGHIFCLPAPAQHVHQEREGQKGVKEDEAGKYHI